MMIKFEIDSETGDYICLPENQIQRVVKSGEESFVVYSSKSGERTKRQTFVSFSVLEAGATVS